MLKLWKVLRLLWRAHPFAMWRGALLAVLVLLMGAALLGLSGWFITATGWRASPVSASPLTSSARAPGCAGWHWAGRRRATASGC